MGVLSSSASTNVWRPAPQPASTTTSKRCSGKDRKTYRLRLSSPGLSLSMPAKSKSIGFGVCIRLRHDLLPFRFGSYDLRQQNVAYVMPVGNYFERIAGIMFGDIYVGRVRVEIAIGEAHHQFRFT